MGTVRRLKVTYCRLSVISEACEREDEKIISYIFFQPFPIYNNEHDCPTHIGHSGAILLFWFGSSTCLKMALYLIVYHSKKIYEVKRTQQSQSFSCERSLAQLGLFLHLDVQPNSIVAGEESCQRANSDPNQNSDWYSQVLCGDGEHSIWTKTALDEPTLKRTDMNIRKEPIWTVRVIFVDVCGTYASMWHIFKGQAHICGYMW